MQKYIVVSIIFVFLSSVFIINKHHQQEIKKLNNIVAEQQTIQQESESVWSRLAIQSDQIILENKALENVVKDRDEKILTLTQTNLKLKGQYFKILDAKQSVVDKEGNIIPSELQPIESQEFRYKVQFEKEQDNLKVVGFTLTNPAYSELHFEWTKPLILSLVITKKDKSYRVYIDSKDKTVVPTDLKLTIDPSLFEQRWFERFFVLTDIGITTQYDIVPSSKISYVFNLTDSIQIYPYLGISWHIKEMKLLPTIGSSLIWYPFKR